MCFKIFWNIPGLINKGGNTVKIPDSFLYQIFLISN